MGSPKAHVISPMKLVVLCPVNCQDSLNEQSILVFTNLSLTSVSKGQKAWLCYSNISRKGKTRKRSIFV